MITSEQIIEAIKSSEELTEFAWIGADGAIAKALEFTEVTPYRLTSTKVVGILGAVRGATVLASLRTEAANNPVYAEVVRMLDNDRDDGGIDLSHADTSDMMAMLVSDAEVDFKQADSDALLVARESTVRPTPKQVSQALRQFRPDGKAHQLVGFEG